jgi:hypothetical protein
MIIGAANGGAAIPSLRRCPSSGVDGVFPNRAAAMRGHTWRQPWQPARLGVMALPAAGFCMQI